MLHAIASTKALPIVQSKPQSYDLGFDGNDIESLFGTHTNQSSPHKIRVGHADPFNKPPWG